MHNNIKIHPIYAYEYFRKLFLGRPISHIRDKFNKRTCLFVAYLFKFIFIIFAFILLSNNTLSMTMLYILCFIFFSFAYLFGSSVNSIHEDLTDINCISLLLILSINFKIESLNEIVSNKTNLKSEFSFICNDKPMFYLIMVFCVFNFFASHILILISSLIKVVLSTFPCWVGYLGTFTFFISSFMALLLSFKPKLNKLYRSMFINMFFIGLGISFLGIFTNNYIIFSELFIIGMGLPVINTLSMSILQRQIPNDLRGRFFSILTTISFIIMTISYLTNSLLTQYFSIQRILIFNGIGSIILLFMVLIIPPIINYFKSSNKKRISEYDGFYIKKLETCAEAEEITKCAYRTYGNSYIHDYIYDVNALMKMNLEKKLISYIAMNYDNKVLGHVALEYGSNPYVLELSHAFVDPSVRGIGYLNYLTEFAINEGKKLNAIGLYVLTVTSHTYSQRCASKYGFKDCALLLSKITPLKFNNICGKTQDRESLILKYKPMKRQRKKIAYIPVHHEKIVNQLYNNLGIKIKFKRTKDQNKLDSSKTSLTCTNADYSVGIIHINAFSIDGTTKLIDEINKLLLKNNKVIFVYLKLCNKSTAYITRYLESLGFIFSGIMPGDGYNDELILQYTNDDIDFKEIASNSIIGNNLINYVKQYDYNSSERKLSI
jgi:N-acetylglutamate synthase-like GNAT family acetyltransferase